MTPVPSPATYHELLRYGDRLCASLFLPRTRTNPHGDQVRFRELVALAGERLRARGAGDPVIDVILAPARQLAANDTAWRGDHAPGLALFCGKDFVQRFALPAPPPETVAVGFGCHVRPFLDLPGATARFLVLAVNKDHARLFIGDALALRPAGFDLPAAEAAPGRMAGRDRAVQRKHAGGATIWYGGGGDDEREHDRLREYFRQVDHALHRAAPGGHTPVLLAGPEHVAALMREVARYPRLLPQTLYVNVDALDAAALHARALPLVAEVIDATRRAALAAFADLSHDPRAARGLDVVLPAAQAGNVEVLLVARDAQAHGRFDAAAGAVLRSAVPAPADDDLLDQAVIATIAHGGSAHQIARADMPDGADAAAILRH